MEIKTNGDFVSEIRNHLKANNKDDYVSARYILSVGYAYVKYFVNNRPLSKIFRSLDAFTYVPCIELERVRTYDCKIYQFKTCDKIMKSKKKLPSILQAKVGYVVESITNINFTEEYQPLRSAAEYITKKKREYADQFKFYYIDTEGYLYLLNTTNEIVNINAYFLDEGEAKCLSDCEDCDECKSKLEDKFICPGEFLSSVRDQTLKLILNGYKNIQRDERPDLDENQRSGGQIQQ